MRGPGFRRDLDVRRVWRCTACGAERRLPGHVTTIQCGCEPEGKWMQIVLERVASPRPPILMVTPEIPVADFQLTAEELARPLEGRVRRPQPNPPGEEVPRGRGPRPGRPNSQETQPDTPDTPDSAEATNEGDDSQATRGKSRRPPKRRKEPRGDQHPPEPTDTPSAAELSPSENTTEPKPDSSSTIRDEFAAGLE